MSIINQLKNALKGANVKGKKAFIFILNEAALEDFIKRLNNAEVLMSENTPHIISMADIEHLKPAIKLMRYNPEE